MTTRNNSQKLLLSSFALMLVAGLVIPASATEHIDANLDDSATPAAAPSAANPLIGEINIGFDPLAGPNFTPYTSHIENGFVVTSISGSWQEAFNVGNPVPSIFSFSPIAGVNIERQGGGHFDLVSMDIGTGGQGNTGITVTCIAESLGNVVGNEVFLFGGNHPAFPTFVFGAGFSNVDTVDCTANPIGTSSVNLDNFVVREKMVGGELLPIDSTALILAGAQTNAVWIMSALAVIGSIAFGALYITSKKN